MIDLTHTNSIKSISDIDPFQAKLLDNLNVCIFDALGSNRNDPYQNMCSLDKTTQNNFVGFCVKDDVTFISGDIPSIEHEIAHFVEMNNYKILLLPDFGFWSNTQLDRKPSTAAAALAREAMVRGIQAHIDTINFSKDAGWLDFFTSKIMTVRVPTYKKITFKPYGKFQKLEDVYDWAEHIFNKTKSDWNKDRIEHEFIKRADFIKDWQKTKAFEKLKDKVNSRRVVVEVKKPIRK